MTNKPRNPPISGSPIRLAVCVSGEGTTLQNLIDQIRARRLNAEVVQVVASRPRIGAIARAEAAGIPLALALQRPVENRFQHFCLSTDPPQQSRPGDPGRVSGVLKIPADYKGRVINIHPSLIPSFSGKGFYGSKVHKAVLAMGAKVSGCTIHFADDDYDNGPIIAQSPVPVREDDTVETLADRVFREECKALPEAITLYAEGRLKLDGRRVWVAPQA